MVNALDENRITYFASTHTRGQHQAFGIRAKDRSKHLYIIGKTGMGKSTLLENMAIQDIQNGEGLAFVDPHGSSAEKLLDFVPEDRIKDVLYFAPFDTDFPIGFNVMEDVGFDKRHLVVSGLMGTFKRIWVDAWSARMEYILSNTLLALLEYPDSTLLDVNRMLVNKSFRENVIAHISDTVVKSFWAEEFASYTDRYTQEATPAIQNKIGQFTSNPLIRNIVGQPDSSFDIRKLMDERKIVIVNLSKGRLGEVNASLLGSMITIKIYLAAMSRADSSPAEMAKLPPFYFYVDEFQSVVNDAFADILSEARKYKLSLTIAHQYIEQMEENVRHAVFGNVGSIIAFRVGPFDAEVLKTIFEPTFFAEDIVNLDKYHMYLTLMIDGAGSQPFSATALPPIENLPVSFANQIIDYSRSRFGRRRTAVEAAVNKRQLSFGGTGNMQGGGNKKNANSGRKNGGTEGRMGRGSVPRSEENRVRQEKPIANETAPSYVSTERPGRSPADIMRERETLKKGSYGPVGQGEQKGHKEGAGGSAVNPALQEAIKAAVGDSGSVGGKSAKKSVPSKEDSGNRRVESKHVTGTVKRVSGAGEPHEGEVTPGVLRKLLNVEE